MNFLDILPREILTQIILYENYKQIIALSKIDEKINRFIRAKSFLFQRSKIGFPRVTGKAIVHDININIDTNESDFEQKRSILRWLIINEIDVINGDILTTTLYDDDIENADNQIHFMNANAPPNLKFTNGIGHEKAKMTFIYDNFKLYRLDSCILSGSRTFLNGPDGYTIPSNIHVITNKAPIDYFDVQIHGFKIQQKIHINHKLVKDQCIKNIKKNELAVSTNFTFDNITYHIQTLFANMATEQFKKILSSDTIEFTYTIPNILLMQVY